MPSIVTMLFYTTSEEVILSLTLTSLRSNLYFQEEFLNDSQQEDLERRLLLFSQGLLSRKEIRGMKREERRKSCNL
jgi:hypothetical protein